MFSEVPVEEILLRKVSGNNQIVEKRDEQVLIDSIIQVVTRNSLPGMSKTRGTDHYFVFAVNFPAFKTYWNGV